MAIAQQMPKQLWFLIIGLMVNVIGSSFLWPLNTIYIHEHLGKSLAVAGVVLMFNSLAVVIGNLLGGMLFDRIGAYRSITLGVGIVTVASCILMFFHEWVMYVLLLIIMGFGSGVVQPAMYATAGTIWPEGGRKTFNALYVAQNVGVAVGTALGGFIASLSFDWIFTGNAIFYILFFFMALFTYRDFPSVKLSKEKKESIFKTNRRSLASLFILCIGFAICWFSYVQWQTTISVHSQNLGVSLSQYSLLWTLNGALIVFGQPFVSLLVGKWFKSLKAQIMVGMTIFLVSFFFVVKAEVFSGFVVGMTILTIGEMFVWPAVPTIASQLAPEGRDGIYQGFVNGMAAFGRMFGPVVGGVLVDSFGITIAMYVIIGFIVFGIFTTSIYDRLLKKEYLLRQNNKAA